MTKKQITQIKMKKEIIYELIKAHYESDEPKFKELSMEIAQYFLKKNFETTGYNLISIIDNEPKMEYQAYKDGKLVDNE